MSAHNGNGVSPDRYLAKRKGSQYRPTALGGNLYGYMGVGTTLFSWRQAAEMRRDPQIKFGLQILRSPLARVKWKVKAKRTEVAEFVDAQLRRFWTRCLRKVAKSFHVFGIHPGEFSNCEEGGLIQIDQLDDFHPTDCRPLEFNSGEHRGKLAGLQVRNILQADSQTNAGGLANILAPHAWWFAGDAEFGLHYGRPHLAGAFEPWLEKRGPKGAIDMRRMGYRKATLIGPKLRFPLGETDFGPDDGSAPHLINNQDVARELVEKWENGSTLALPNVPHASDKMAGKYAWEWEDPAPVGELPQLLEYPESLDKEILRGLNIPPEIVDAATVGSGFSGRAIPCRTFFSMVDEDVALIISAADEQQIRGLVAVNFGRAAYEIIPDSLADAMEADPDAAAEALKGAGSDDEEEGQQKQPVQMSHGSPASPKLVERIRALADEDYPDLGPVQLSFDESKVKRDKGQFATQEGSGKEQPKRFTGTVKGPDGKDYGFTEGELTSAPEGAKGHHKRAAERAAERGGKEALYLPEVGDDIRDHHATNMKLLVKAMAEGRSKEYALTQVEHFHRQAVRAEQKNFSQYYDFVMGRIAAKYGQDAVNTPEFGKIKAAFDAAQAEVVKKIDGITQAARDVAESTAPAEAADLKSIDKAAHAHQSAHWNGESGINAAIKAFVDKPPAVATKLSHFDEPLSLSFDESKVKRDAGKFAAQEGAAGKEEPAKPKEEATKHGSRAARFRAAHEEAKRVRQEAFDEVKADADKVIGQADTAAKEALDFLDSTPAVQDSKDKSNAAFADLFNEIETQLRDYEPDEPARDKFERLKAVRQHGKKAIRLLAKLKSVDDPEDDNFLSHLDKTEAHAGMAKIIAAAEQGIEGIRTYGRHLKELKAIKTGEFDDMPDDDAVTKLSHFADEPLALSFDESAHHRGQPSNAGQFGGGGGAAKDSSGAATAKKPADSKPTSTIPGLSEGAQANPGKVRRAASLVKNVALTAVNTLSAQLGSGAAAIVLPEAADSAKLTFTGAGFGADAVRDAMGISANDAILIASHVLSRVALWAKRKLTGNPEARLSDGEAGPDVGAHADAVIGLLDDVGKVLGLTGYTLPDREELMVKLADRMKGDGAVSLSFDESKVKRDAGKFAAQEGTGGKDGQVSGKPASKKPSPKNGSSKHPLDGMTREQQLSYMRQEMWGKSATTNPRGYDTKNYPSHVDGDKVAKSVVDAVSAIKKGNSFARASIGKVFAAIANEHPELSIDDLHRVLAKMTADGNIRPVEWTLPLNEYEGDLKELMPLDHGYKAWLELGSRAKMG